MTKIGLKFILILLLIVMVGSLETQSLDEPTNEYVNDQHLDQGSWIQKLKYFEVRYHNFLRREKPPFTFYYAKDKPRIENIDYTIGNAQLYVDYHLNTNTEWIDTILDSIVKATQIVYDELHLTGQAQEWELENWPNTGISTSNPFGRDWTYKFMIGVNYINNYWEVEFSHRLELKGSYRIFLDEDGKIGYNFQNEMDEEGQIPSTMALIGLENDDNIIAIGASNLNMAQPKVEIVGLSREVFDSYKLSGNWVAEPKVNNISGEITEQQLQIFQKQIEEAEQSRKNRILGREQRILEYQIEAKGKYPQIDFAGFEWFILEKQDDRALLITKQSILNISFNPLETLSSIWVNSNLRHYLNNEFYYSLSLEDQVRIIPTQITTRDLYSEDKIFILSGPEIRKYFPKYSKISSLQNRISSSESLSVYPWLPRADLDTFYYRDGFYRHPIVSGVRPALWIRMQE